MAIVVHQADGAARQMSDGHLDARPGHRIIKGRWWRITDPSIPDGLRQQLVNELMDARRAVAAANRSDDAVARRHARQRVQRAKIALGERGPKWWLPMHDDAIAQRAEATLRALLQHRRPDASLCPSEVSRVIGADRWRSVQPLVLDCVWSLQERGSLMVTQRGEPVDQAARGPIRGGGGGGGWVADRRSITATLRRKLSQIKPCRNHTTGLTYLPWPCSRHVPP